jgi:hypothetical protein
MISTVARLVRFVMAYLRCALTVGQANAPQATAFRAGARRATQTFMRSTRGSLTTMMVAVFAAYLVVLQALLGGLASGSHAGMAYALGASGEIICSGAADLPGHPAEPAHHTPDCCLTGCNMPIAAGALPQPAALPALLPVALAILVPAQPETRSSDTARGPHKARAPPLA